MTNKEILQKSLEFDSKDVDLIKNAGVVFTPASIVGKIIKASNIKITETVCEPSVGKGIFVFGLLESFRKNHTLKEIVNFVENNLFCYDINEDFITEFKDLLNKYFINFGYTGINLDNIVTTNYLFTEKTYDHIIGNPPYVKVHNIETELLSQYREKFKSLETGNIDLYYAFIEKGLQDAKNLNFIIPNEFVKNKSGLALRKMLSQRISNITDFKVKKVWKNISTYTCIISCQEYKEKTYYNDKEIDTTKDNWLSNNEGENKLIDLVNYVGIGIQTSADKLFLVKDFDEEYGYINNQKIELSICKKIINASSSSSFEDHFYVIYPYNKENKSISEDELSKDYPFAYKYLLSVKEELEKRSMDDVWYAYGRRQGLLRGFDDNVLILPLTFSKSKNIHIVEVPDGEECLALKGLIIDVKDKAKFIEIIQSSDFLEYLEDNNRTLPDSNPDNIWLTLKSTNIKKYRYASKDN